MELHMLLGPDYWIPSPSDVQVKPQVNMNKFCKWKHRLPVCTLTADIQLTDSINIIYMGSAWSANNISYCIILHIIIFYDWPANKATFLDCSLIDYLPTSTRKADLLLQQPRPKIEFSTNRNFYEAGIKQLKKRTSIRDISSHSFGFPRFRR